MADDVSILQEIDEALRADRVQEFWENNKSALVTFCVLLVLSTAASAFWRNHQRETHIRQSGELMQASILADAGKYPEAIAAFEQLEKEGGPIAPLAALRHAQVFIDSRQDEKALGVYNELAAGKIGSPTDAERDFGALEADILSHNLAQAAGKEPQATEGGKAARAKGRPFADMFAELDALRAKDPGQTQELLKKVVDDDDAPYSQRRRDIELGESLKGASK